MSMLPKLDESHIRKLATEESFRRGMSYYLDGAILEPLRQGMELQAECQGSRYEPYLVSATLTKDGIRETSCTCPYNHGGICKHAVVLLLTYVHEPRAFRILQPLEEMLAGHSREELIALIGEIVRRKPDLLFRVELLAGRHRDKPVDAETYRRQVRRAIRQGSLDTIEWELRTLKGTAEELAEAGHWLNAGELYRSLLSGAVAHYDDGVIAMDEEGEIATLVGEFAEGLARCLEKGNPGDEGRRAWLEVLLDAVVADIELGGIDLAPAAEKAILNQATDDDWQWIEERVREGIEKSSGWSLETLVDLLAERYTAESDRKGAAAIVRELGTPEQQAFLLVEEGRIEEAMRLIDEIVIERPRLVIEYAEALVEAGAEEAAIRLVEGSAEKGYSTRCAKWLARHYHESGNTLEELEWQLKAFLQDPSVDGFKTLQEAAIRVGRWEQVRSHVLKTLESMDQIGPLIEIALHEGNVARALELLPRLDGWQWQDYKRMVAQAAEKDCPQKAVALYKEMAEGAIDMRQRSAYQQATGDLKRVQALYDTLDAGSEWDSYIQTLRTRYARLKALQNELDRAGL